MGHGTVQGGVAQEEPKYASILRRKPVGYDTVIRYLPWIEKQINGLMLTEQRTRERRQELEAFVRPYRFYEEVLNNSITQATVEET